MIVEQDVWLMAGGKAIRDSKYELLRIVSMFMIVFYHLIIHSGLRDGATSFFGVAVNFVVLLMIVHVNLFVLVTGYYQSKSQFKMSKLLSLTNQVGFYMIICALLIVVFDSIPYTTFSVARMVFPFNFTGYWFIGIYVILYLISPILNHIIASIDKKKFQKMILVLFFIFSIMTTLTGQTFFQNHGGYSLGNFILLYMIGAYFREYPVEKSYLFKKVSRHSRMLIFLLLFIGCAVINLFAYYFSIYIASFGDNAAYISRFMQMASTSYDNPLVIIGAVSLFLWFGSLTIQNRGINMIAASTLGVYLLHDNNFLREALYKWLDLSANGAFYSKRILLKMFLLAVLIFVIGTIIEQIRQAICKFFYKRKVSQKWRDTYRKFLDSFGMKINW